MHAALNQVSNGLGQRLRDRATDCRPAHQTGGID